MRRGNIVRIPKEPKKGECVVIDVKYSVRGEALVHLANNGGIFWTRASNCEKVLDSRSQ